MICIDEATWTEIGSNEYDLLRRNALKTVAVYTRVDGDEFGPGRLIETVWELPDGRWIQCSDGDERNGGHRHWVGVPHDESAALEGK